jgi:hypothetical protein
VTAVQAAATSAGDYAVAAKLDEEEEAKVVKATQLSRRPSMLADRSLTSKPVEKDLRTPPKTSSKLVLQERFKLAASPVVGGRRVPMLLLTEGRPSFSRGTSRASARLLSTEATAASTSSAPPLDALPAASANSTPPMRESPSPPRGARTRRRANSEPPVHPEQVPVHLSEEAEAHIRALFAARSGSALKQAIERYQQEGPLSIRGHTAAMQALVESDLDPSMVCNSVVALYEEMLQKGLPPSLNTLSNVILAYAGYARWVHEARAALDEELEVLSKARLQAWKTEEIDLDKAIERREARKRRLNASEAARAAFQLYRAMGGNRFYVSDTVFVRLLRLCVLEKQVDMGTTIVSAFFSSGRANSAEADPLEIVQRPAAL